MKDNLSKHFILVGSHSRLDSRRVCLISASFVSFSLSDYVLVIISCPDLIMLCQSAVLFSSSSHGMLTCKYFTIQTILNISSLCVSWAKVHKRETKQNQTILKKKMTEATKVALLMENVNLVSQTSLSMAGINIFLLMQFCQDTRENVHSFLLFSFKVLYEGMQHTKKLPL